MKRIALMFVLFFAVALIFPANAPAPIQPICGDGVINQAWEECDPPDDSACMGECVECLCPEPPVCGDGKLDPGEECDGDAGDCAAGCREDCTCPKCGDGILDPGEECDGDAGDCATVCLDDCTCEEPPGTCEPRTQGFWKRVCDGVYGWKAMHPETPESFSDRELCADLMVREDRDLPCVRSASQIAALKLNSKYGILDGNCKVYYDDMEMTVKDVLDKIDEINGEDCKEAADLAEAINSRDAL